MEAQRETGAGGQAAAEIVSFQLSVISSRSPISVSRDRKQGAVKLTVKIEGRAREVELTREAGRLRCRLDGRERDLDTAEIAPGTYSILLDGQAFELHVQEEADGLRIETGGEVCTAAIIDPRRWQGRHGHTLEVEGRLQILAPMPGKIVRVLVRQGDAVQAGQGIAVVEAMKMQNEVRSRKTGIVEKLLVVEGKTVSAGEVVAVVA
jgi:biotin carboxyl carrier protein